MKIGKWRERILVQLNAVVADEVGNQKHVWTDYYRCHTYVNHLSGKEYWEAAQLNQENTLLFIVRYCRELEALDASRYRILFRGKVWNITFVDFMQYQKRWITVRAKQEKR